MSEALFDDVRDVEEASALMRAFDRIMSLIELDPGQEPEMAKRIGRTLRKVFRANSAELPVDELAYATVVQFRADSAPINA